MSFLDDLIQRLQDAEDAAARTQLITAAVTTDEVDLSAIAEELVKKSGAVKPDGDNEISDEQVAYLALLTEISQSVSARSEAIDAERQAAERRATAKALAEKIAATRTPTVPEPQPEPPVDEVNEDTQAGEVTEGTSTGKAVAASGGQRRIPLGSMRATGPDRRPVHLPPNLPVHLPTTRGERYVITASGDGPGFFSGQEFPTMSALAAAAAAKVQSLARVGQGSGRVGLATFTRTVDPEYLIEEEMRDWGKLERCADERTLPGGSLVAALAQQRRALTAATAAPNGNGTGPTTVVPAADPPPDTFAYAWCAPMDILRDLCPLEGTLEGMVDLPTMTTTRGGIMWPKTPDYSEVFKDSPFCFSYDDMQDPKFAKPCVEIPCDTGWEQVILDACSFCVIDNMLMARIDDSLVQRAIQQGLFLQRRALNAKRIQKMIDITTARSGGNVVVSTDDLSWHGPGMFESILSFLSLQVEYLRARKRLAKATTFEALLPVWALPLMVTDLSKKLGIQDRWSIGERDVANWLAERGIRAQYVYEFQDASVDPSVPMGGPTRPNKWPSTLKVLLYQAGTFQAIQGPSLQLDALYDSELLKKNKRVRLFVEDMQALISRCGISYLYEIPLCPDGVSGGTGTNPCSTTPPPPAPAAPTNVTATKTTASGFTVNWQWAKGSGGDATGFTIQTRTPPGSGTWSTPVTAGPTDTSKDITGLTANTQYDIQVIAVGDGGSSDPATGSGKTAANGGSNGSRTTNGGTTNGGTGN